MRGVGEKTMREERERRERVLEQALEMKGLTLGAGLPPEKVKNEICPSCPYHTAFCDFRMSLWLDKPDLAFVCPGMRAWVKKNN